MTYRLKLGKSLKAGVGKVARKQLEGALRGLETDAAQRADAIHDIRLHLKKLRAVLRLVRGELGGDYQVENACFREAGHALSEPRDAQAALKQLGELARRAGQLHGDDASFRDALELLRGRLTENQRALDERSTAELWNRIADALRSAAARVESWSSKVRGFETIADGLENSYRRGRRAMIAALRDPRPEMLHEWRKQAKYHRYQINLLEDAWPELMKSRTASLKRLSDLLGDDHDLVVLAESARNQLAGHDALPRCIELVDRRRDELFEELKPLGRLLYAEKPKGLRRRIEAYWQIRCADAEK
ncbi:MAG TPA: CHAD domain-containing protein [Pirellulales bacterium]|jgi:CHAD domain-containing protein|nr:CHAD domain-containing protein [Pirellulales bacterium]